MHRKECKKYVAKKIILQGLSSREQEGCMMEVNLLKNLNHPNIVAYKESFLVPEMMIIIMEFCEGETTCVDSFSRGPCFPHQENAIAKGQIHREGDS